MDISPSKSDFVNVNGVRLHYLDWGGSGQVLLFLTGLGNSAHIFDDLAPQFTDQFRVLGLTRRGHGQSDKPETGYDLSILIEDIHQFLGLITSDRVILIGHSWAGDEMTYFAQTYPDRVRKLIYLDAAYDHSKLTDSVIIAQAPGVFKLLALTSEDLQSLGAFRNWYQTKRFGFWSDAQEADMCEMTVISAEGKVLGTVIPQKVQEAIEKSMHESQIDYSQVKAPALAFYSIPTLASWFPWLASHVDSSIQREAQDLLNDVLIPNAQKNIEKFRVEMISANVVELENTNHYCFIHRRDEVVSHMREFLLGE